MANFTLTMKNFLTNFQRVLVSILGIVLFSAFSAAGKTTVVDIVVNSENHTTLEAAVLAAGLAETLSGDGPFTVFAPTDAAFAALPAGTVDALLADPSGALTSILKYHVLAGKVLSTDLSDGLSATTLLGKNVKVTINEQGVFINGAKVTVKDVMADNGVVHVLDAVLTVPDDVKIAEVAAFGKILTDSQGRSLYFLSRDVLGQSTCIDGCLDNWPIFYSESLSIGEGLNAADFGTITASNSAKQTTYKGWPLYYYINDLKAGDILGNGRSNVWFVAKPDYSIMLVNNQLKGNNGVNYKGDYTPGDQVIQYFTDGYGRTLYTWSRDFNKVNKFTKNDFSNNSVWPIYEKAEIVLPSTLDASLFSVIDVYGRKQLTYNGLPLYYFGGDGQVRGNSKGVSVPSPGVWPVAVKDMAAAKPATVAEVVINSESHNTLEAAVVAAGLAETLSGVGPFTVFAPTDAAFTALPAGTVETLLADPSGALTDILKYHVLAGNVLSTDLSNGMTATTLLGDNIKISINVNGVFINDAKVTVKDIVTGNGVVHVIDAVLSPPADVKIVEAGHFGKILTDKQGRTLYFLSRDANGLSTCIDGCLDNWPVFYTESMFLSEGLNAADFGTITTATGAKQTTYKGWPLYYYINDLSPGVINGNGRSNVWFIAKPDYSIMLANNQLKGNDGVNYKGDYTAGDQVIQYFTDSYGRTLYTWSRDFNKVNKFTKNDFSNNSVWPIYEKTEIVLPSTLDASLFSVIDVHGRKQLTYKGWPLYYFGADGQVRGNSKGVSVPTPGVWPVAVKDIAAAKPATVVDVVVNSESHNTLEAALLAADLTETLSGVGQFTVFAPTDAAFAALPAGTVEALLADPSGALTNILKYHVIAGNILSTDLTDGMKATTLLGKNVKVTINANGVFINGAKVTVANIVTGNGVVHVIDAVLLPKTTVVDVIVNSENHKTLEAAVIAAGLAETLSGDGPLTVFAPTDDAFAALPAGTVEALLADPSGALTDILKYHVVAGKVMSSDLRNSQVVTTLSGKLVTVSINSNGVFINKSKVIVADIETDNGVVHVLDVVLVPLTPTSSVEISKGEQIFRIYPNPASSNLTIDLDENLDLNSKLSVSIARLDGRIVVDIPANNSRLTYNVGNLSPGMYLVSVTKNGRKQTEKLIVN